MSIEIAGFVTSVGDLFKKAATFAQKIQAAIHIAVKDMNAAAPLVEAVLTAINPGYGAADKAIVDIINAVDAAITAAEGQAAGGAVTVTLPAQLVADFQTAKAAILPAAQHL